MTDIKRKNYYLLMCYIQNKGKRNKINVHYVQVKYKEVFGLVTRGLLVHFIGSMGHDTEFYAGYITSSCIWLAMSGVENTCALMHSTQLLLLHEWNDRKPEHDMNYIYAIKYNLLCIQQITDESSQNRLKGKPHSTWRPGERVSYKINWF